MTNGKENSWLGPAIISGMAGFAFWKSLRPETRAGVWRFLDEIAAQAAAEQERRRREAEAVFRPPAVPAPSAPVTVLPYDPPPLATREIAEIFKDKAPSADLPPLSWTLDLPVSSGTEAVPALLEPDRRWLEVVRHPSVVVIAGRRGSGKSALAYRLLELSRYRAKPYAVGIPDTAQRLLPEWIGTVPTLEDLPAGAIALVDEAYLAFHARESMSSANRSLSEALNLSRQRDLTLIFVTQEARQLDRNIMSVADVIVFRKLSAMQVEMERPELRALARRANEAFANARGPQEKLSYVFAPDVDFEGLLENRLPSFWTPRLSKAFASGSAQGESSHPRPTTKDQKQARAKELRATGQSLSQIAAEIGVSKSTVINYLKGYPYQP